MAKKVLIIDDSYTQLSSLKILFKREGYDVDTARNGVEGYTKIFKNTPDIILCDVLMPHLGGFQLCRLVKSDKMTCEIPFIMLTVLDKNLDKFWAGQSGADMFLRKDYDMSKIVSSAKELIEKMPVADSTKRKLSYYEVEEDAIIGQINKILDEELMKTTIANKFRNLSSYAADTIELAKNIFQILSSIIDYDAACIYFHTPDSAAVKKFIFHENKILISNKAMDEFQAKLLPENKRAFIPERITTEDNITEHISSYNDLISKKELNFYNNKDLTGKLCLYSRDIADWDTSSFLATIQGELDLFLRLKFLYTRISYLSITDELTGLYTRRHFKSALTQEFDRARRYKNATTLVMADIDNFKKINDEFGHLAGDYVLKRISEILLSNMRKTDSAFRYGGEEICILMPETTPKKAFIPLERLRIAIEEEDFIFEGQKMKVTISMGASCYSDKLSDIDEMIEKADSAMYEAKNSGKNRVVILEE